MIKNFRSIFKYSDFCSKRRSILTKFVLGFSAMGCSGYLINKFKPTIFIDHASEYSMLSVTATTSQPDQIKPLNVIADMIETISPSVVMVTVGTHPKPTGVGAGFVIDESGYIITNRKAIGKTSFVYVKLHNGKIFYGKVVEFDKKYELALVKINPVGVKLQPLTFVKDKSKIRQGDFVIAFGCPIFPVTFGIVSTVERASGMSNGLKYIQTDAVTAYGNFGGPLVNLNSEVVGVNTQSGVIGLGFAVPCDHSREFVDSALHRIQSDTVEENTIYKAVKLQQVSKESSTNDRFGVVMGPITPQIAPELKGIHPGHTIYPQTGVIIHSVLDKSPANKSGLHSGDIVESVNGKKVNSPAELMKSINEVGNFDISLIRRGKRVLMKKVIPEYT